MPRKKLQLLKNGRQGHPPNILNVDCSREQQDMSGMRLFWAGPQEHCRAPPGRWKNFLLPLPFKCNSVCPLHPTHPVDPLAGSGADLKPFWEKTGSFSLTSAWLESLGPWQISFSSLSASLSWIPPNPRHSKATMSSELFPNGMEWR